MSQFSWIARQVNWVANQRFAWYWRYGITVVIVALAFLVTWAIPAIRTGSPFMFFFLAVSVSALLGNFRAGLLATLLSVIVVGLWIMPPVGTFKVMLEDFVRLGGFFVVATLISLLAYSVKQAHQVAFEQAEWLRATLASIGDGVIATDQEGKVVWLNAVAAKLTGWEMHEAIAQPLEQVFSVVEETTRTPVASAVEHVLAKGESLGPVNHMILTARDGRDHPIENSAAPIRSVQGAMAGAVLIFHDISERREREKTLQATEERLQIALKAGHMVAWEWDVQRNSMWTTDNFADIFGVPPIQSVAQGVHLLHPDDVAAHQNAVNRVREGSGGYQVDFRIVRPDNGRVVWIEEWGFAVPTQPGQPIARVVGVTADITERKLAEEQIQRLNAELTKHVQELQAIFDTAWVGIAVAEDPSLNVVVRNQTLAEWFGVPKGRGVARSTAAGANLPFTLFHEGKEMPPDALPMQRAIATGQSVVSEELEVVRSDGQRMTVVASATPTFDDDGCVSGCVGIFTDISNRKAAERALHQLNLTLEERVAERTAELEQINRELVEFTNVVSHDLRSPLRAITLLADWVSEESALLLPAHSKEHLTKMRQRIQRMENLLNDLVAYTRAGRVHYSKEQVDTSVLVRDIFQLLDAPQNFRTEVVEPMPRFVTERVPLETVLRNLISNAFKHHPEPERGRVVVSGRDVGSQFEFSVADNGAGIRTEYQGRIFGVFQTLRPRDEVEGSGMGLAIAKRLVEGRGGRITVESGADHGSIFKFTWPK